MLQIDPKSNLQIALQHHQAGRLPQAEAIYRQVLAQDPNNPEALHLLGMIALQSGQLQAAVELIGRAIAINPAASHYYNNLGEVWRRLGQPEKAIECYRQAIVLDPNYPAPHGNMGQILQSQGRIDEAIIAHRMAVKLEPRSAQAHCNLADVLVKAGKTDEAMTAYRTSIALEPAQCNAHNNLGALLVSLGQLNEAETEFRAALLSNPNEVDVHQNLGDLLLRMRRTGDAHRVYQRITELNPKSALAYLGLGNTLKNSNRPDDAITAYRKAIELDPTCALAYANLGGTLRDRGQLDDAIAALRKAVEVNPQLAAAHSSLILTLYLQTGVDRQVIENEQRLWNERYAKPLAATIAPHVNDPNPERRLRIAYLSPDLREHPVGRFMLPLLENHAHKYFDVFCYNSAAVPDALGNKLRSHADTWRDIAALDDQTLARVIREDQIDVLIDLAMHTVDNRLLTLARKPAPVQITYLATCHGTGLQTMDYRITDPYLDPSDTDANPPFERPLQLAETYWCYAPAMETPPVGAVPALTAGHITFGSLNHFCKITAAAMATWCRVLEKVTGSRLMLHVPAGSPQQRVRDAFSKEGIELARLELVARVPTPEYFALYHKIDIGLDPFPYVGGTTSCDALWMGVPVVTLAGQFPTSRGGLSILSNVGLAELAANDLEQYINIAAELACDLPKLVTLRESLRQRMRESPLMDAPRFTRNMEDAYRRAWRAWSAGRS